MLSKVYAFLAGIVAIAGLVIAAFLKGRSNGKEEVKQEVVKEQTKAVEEVAAKRVENVKVVNRVQQKVTLSSDKAVDKELNDEWTRG